jgi:hypothetical protein
MSGGVGGEELWGSPLSQSTQSQHGNGRVADNHLPLAIVGLRKALRGEPGFRSQKKDAPRLSGLLSAEAEDDAGAISEVILVVACTVRKFCQKVFGLNGANRQVFGDFEVNTSARSHREGVLGRVVDAPGSSK